LVHIRGTTLPKRFLLIGNPFLPQYTRWRTESLEHVHRVLERLDETILQSRDEHAVGNSFGPLGRRLRFSGQGLKVLGDRSALQQRRLSTLEEKDRTVCAWVVPLGCGHVRPLARPSCFTAASATFETAMVSLRWKPSAAVALGRSSRDTIAEAVEVRQ